MYINLTNVSKDYLLSQVERKNPKTTHCRKAVLQERYLDTITKGLQFF